MMRFTLALPLLALLLRQNQANKLRINQEQVSNCKVWVARKVVQAVKPHQWDKRNLLEMMTKTRMKKGVERKSPGLTTQRNLQVFRYQLK